MVAPNNLGRQSFRLPTDSINSLTRELTRILSSIVQGNRNKLVFIGTVDIPSIASGASHSEVIIINDIKIGDVILGFSFATGLLGLDVSSEVTNTNELTIHFKNNTLGSVDLPETTFRAIIEKMT